MKQILITIAAVVLVGCGNPDGALFQTVKDINIEAAKQAIADGSDVNAKDQNGRTPLQIAALKGHKEVAELLIAEGADVNEIAPGKEGPLTEFNAALIATKIISCHIAGFLSETGE